MGTHYDKKLDEAVTKWVFEEGTLNYVLRNIRSVSFLTTLTS